MRLIVSDKLGCSCWSPSTIILASLLLSYRVCYHFSCHLLLLLLLYVVFIRVITVIITIIIIIILVVVVVVLTGIVVASSSSSSSSEPESAPASAASASSHEVYGYWCCFHVVAINAMQGRVDGTFCANLRRKASLLPCVPWLCTGSGCHDDA